MKVTSHTIDAVDSLSLLTLKVASNVFDVSSGVHHASVRDQIVRARMVVRDLKKGDRSLERLLVVGAGVAGMSAALTACELGVKEVVVVETMSQPFALLRNVNARHVGPFMYEWPSPFFDNQSYPGAGVSPWLGKKSSPLRWESNSPLSSDELAKLLQDDLEGRYVDAVEALPHVLVNVDKWRITEFVKRFAKSEAARSLARLQRQIPVPAEKLYYSGDTWPSLLENEDVFSPQYIILAAGMGKENLELIPGPDTYRGKSFWSNDDLLKDATRGRRVAIFGGGDGALQDVLRSLTGFEHPLKFIKHLESNSDVKRALKEFTPQLLSMDRQGRQFSGWTKGPAGFISVDNYCRDIAGKLARKAYVVRRVLTAIRSPIRKAIDGDEPEVALFVRESYFDKAYLLNRFLVHLVDACLRAPPSIRARKRKGQPTLSAHLNRQVTLRIFWQHQAVAYAANSGRHVVTVEDLKTNLRRDYVADRVVVRYGILSSTVPGGQMIQVSQKATQQRTTLCRVELPFAAP